MKVGLLYPSSNAYANMGMQYINALRKCLSHNGVADKIQLMPESIGFGGNEKEAYKLAEKLLVVDNVDVLVAYIDLKVLTLLEPLVLASGKLMLVVNTGANFPQNWVAQPSTVFLTLQHSFLCWLTGAKAAQSGNKNALLATSFYECGYLHPSAMIKHFTESGGSITYNYVNNQAYDSNFHINELLGFLSAANCNTANLLCVLDTAPANLFYQLLSTFEKADTLHLFASPMMLENAALGNSAKPFSIDGYNTWDVSFVNESNKDFLTFYTQQNKQAVNIFTLQGWETALVLQQIYSIANNNYTDGEALVQSLLQQPITTPRGDLKLDEETHYYTAPFVQYSLAANAVSPSIQLVEDYQKEWAAFTANPVEGVSSGWLNTYLCY